MKITCIFRVCPHWHRPSFRLRSQRSSVRSEDGSDDVLHNAAKAAQIHAGDLNSLGETLRPGIARRDSPAHASDYEKAKADVKRTESRRCCICRRLVFAVRRFVCTQPMQPLISLRGQGQRCEATPTSVLLRHHVFKRCLQLNDPSTYTISTSALRRMNFTDLVISPC